MIELTKESYVEKIWFQAIDGGEVDVLAVLLHSKKEGPWRFIWRVRFGPNCGESSNTANWHEATMAARSTADEVLKQVDEVLTVLGIFFHAPLHELEVHGSGFRAIELLSQQTWAHFNIALVTQTESN